MHIRPPIIVSTPVEDSFLPSPVVVESPISCSFSAYLDPASTSQPHLSIPEVPTLPDKENNAVPFPPPPASRRRTTDSGDRRRKSVGQTLSKFGTNSLSNLRRSVGSTRSSSTATFSTADLPPSPTLPSHLATQTPRMALSPTMHSRGSILLETRDIEDAESRRLCEMAFLD
ncbi:hypothetical protein F5I97DRAFT_1812199 [Phlebopus sp. FC_14]|nr:hypothetical protein F5I97DRAFT_1812199 [Phlebopus sp. FC_14]